MFWNHVSGASARLPGLSGVFKKWRPVNVLPSGNVGSAGRRESMYVQNMWSSNWKTGWFENNKKRNHFTFSAAVASCIYY